AALRPAAAVIDVSPQHAVPPHAIEMISAASIPSLRVGAESAAPDGCAPIDDGIADAVYREIVRAVGGRVLVVDDDERFRTVLLSYLRPHCPKAVAIGDPREALPTARSGGTDCLVLDLIMP